MKPRVANITKDTFLVDLTEAEQTPQGYFHLPLLSGPGFSSMLPARRIAQTVTSLVVVANSNVIGEGVKGGAG